MKDKGYEDRVFFLATLVKLVAEENIDCISHVARNIKNRFHEDEIHDLDNHLIYDAYCSCEKEMSI